MHELYLKLVTFRSQSILLLSQIHHTLRRRTQRSFSFLITGHAAQLLGLLPFAFILFCPLMMLFMMKGMQGMGGEQGSHDARASAPGRDHRQTGQDTIFCSIIAKTRRRARPSRLRRVR
jgi:Protein of unknown function (DUF2933)